MSATTSASQAPVTGFDDRIEFGELQRDIVEHALVLNFNDIATGLADFGGHWSEERHSLAPIA